MTESAVLRQCQQYLKLRGIYCWRQNNTGVIKGAFVAHTNGIADILGILPGGRFLAVECKSDTGRQSKAQKQFENRVAAAGGLYVLARSLDDLMRALERASHA